MPPNQYEYYNRKDNGQAALLTDVRNILAEEYPDQTVKKDRLVVQIIFKNFYVEVQPVFRQDDGKLSNSLKAIMGEHGALQNLFTKGGYDRIFAR